MPIYEEKIKVNGQKRWFIRTYITDENGNCKQITKHSKEWLGRDGYWLAQQEENKLKNGEYNSFDKMTLNDLFKNYIEYKKKELKASTIRKAEDNYNLHIAPILGKKKIILLTNKDILNFHDYLEKKENKIVNHTSKRKQGTYFLSTAFKQSIHITLVAILNFGCKYYNLKHNVASIVGNFKIKKGVQKKNINFLTEEEFLEFIKFETSEIYKNFFTILFYTGMRRGELLALTKKDIDFKNNLININKSINPKNGIIATVPKTCKSNRTINMLNIVKNILKGIDTDNNECLFGIDKIKLTTLQRKCDSNCKKANINRNIRIHDFRHSFASMCINKNVPIEIISEYLGHESTTTTLNVYAHLYPNSQDKLIYILEKQDQKQDQAK